MPSAPFRRTSKFCSQLGHQPGPPISESSPTEIFTLQHGHLKTLSGIKISQMINTKPLETTGHAQAGSAEHLDDTIFRPLCRNRCTFLFLASAFRLLPRFPFFLDFDFRTLHIPIFRPNTSSEENTYIPYMQQNSSPSHHPTSTRATAPRICSSSLMAFYPLKKQLVSHVSWRSRFDCSLIPRMPEGSDFSTRRIASFSTSLLLHGVSSVFMALPPSSPLPVLAATGQYKIIGFRRHILRLIECQSVPRLAERFPR